MRLLALFALLALILAGVLLWTPDLDRPTLEAKYLESATDLVTVAGARLHVRDRGPKDAPAILLLHGFASSLQTWDAWVPSLSKTHRVLRIDLPGAGLSDPDANGDYRDERSVEVIVALLDGLGIGRATLVGNSMGGRIAWTFAAARPDRTDRLVLISPDGFASPGFEYGRAPKVGAMAKAMRHVLPKPLVRQSLAPAYADRSVMTDAVTDRYYQLLRAPGARDALIARMEQSIRTDPVPRLASIRAPTLILWGDEDRLIPVANAVDYARAIPGATVVRFPGVGHIPQEEIPDRSLAALQSFLR